jgi:hypothetical protein
MFTTILLASLAQTPFISIQFSEHSRNGNTTTYRVMSDKTWTKFHFSHLGRSVITKVEAQGTLTENSFNFLHKTLNDNNYKSLTKINRYNGENRHEYQLSFPLEKSKEYPNGFSIAVFDAPPRREDTLCSVNIRSMAENAPVRQKTHDKYEEFANIIEAIEYTCLNKITVTNAQVSWDRNPKKKGSVLDQLELKIAVQAYMPKDWSDARLVLLNEEKMEFACIGNPPRRSTDPTFGAVTVNFTYKNTNKNITIFGSNKKLTLSTKK